LSLLLFLPVVKRKTMRWLVLLLALSSIVVMPSGCSVSTLNTQADEVSILVVTASAGTGSSTVVNSSQLTVQVRP